MLRAAYHIPILASAVILGVAGCARDSEAEMRARLAPIFALGETLAFQAETRCAAGAFRLVHNAIGAGLPVQTSVPGWVRAIAQSGAGALDVLDMAPDAAMVMAANTNRSVGMAMRRTSLEARECMDDRIRTEFLRLLLADGIVVGFDAEDGAVMLMDRRNAVLVVAMGEKP